MHNLLLQQYQEKRKNIIDNKAKSKNDIIIITDGIRIERTISKEPIHSSHDYFYDAHNIYFHFILDADLYLYTANGNLIGHMETDEVYQAQGSNRFFTQRNLSPLTHKLTFIISTSLLKKWQENYQIPQWLEYKQSGDNVMQQIALGRYHKRIMLLVQQLLFMDIKTLSDKLSFKSSALSICSSIFQLYSISKNNNFIDDVLFLIHKDPLKKWHFSTLAKQVGTNECYLKQEFKNKTGISIGRYIKNLRMQEALELIINHKLSTKEAAYKIGYTDVGYFARIFKQQFGYTPSDLI